MPFLTIWPRCRVTTPPGPPNVREYNCPSCSKTTHNTQCRSSTTWPWWFCFHNHALLMSLRSGAHGQMWSVDRKIAVNTVVLTRSIFGEKTSSKVYAIFSWVSVIVIAYRIDQLGPMYLTHYLLILNQGKRRLFALSTLCTEFLFVRDLLHSCLALRDFWQGE